jgi:anti-anti-sigma factor
MPLTVTSRSERNCQVITAVGNLTLGPHLKNLQQAVRAALEAGSPEGMIVDVSGLRYADSAGLGELTILYTLCNKKQCFLVLTGVPAQLKQMLELTRLDALLPSATDVEAAKRHIKLQLHKTHDAVAGE